MTPRHRSAFRQLLTAALLLGLLVGMAVPMAATDHQLTVHSAQLDLAEAPLTEGGLTTAMTCPNDQPADCLPLTECGSCLQGCAPLLASSLHPLLTGHITHTGFPLSYAFSPISRLDRPPRLLS